MTTELVKKEAPGVIVNWEERLAQEARDEAAKEKVFAPKLSNQGGILKLGGQALDGNKLQGVILNSVFVKTLYETDFDPDDFTPPSCWAIAEEEEALAPTEQCWKQVHQTCAGCPANEFRTADRGKGKACGDKRRLIVMAANDLASVETIRQAELATLEISPTGLKGWSIFKKGIKDNFNRPPHGMITEITPLAMKTWHIWSFKPVGLVDPGLLGAIYEKRDSVKEQLLQGWDKPSEDPAAKVAQKASKKF